MTSKKKRALQKRGLRQEINTSQRIRIADYSRIPRVDIARELATAQRVDVRNNELTQYENPPTVPVMFVGGAIRQVVEQQASFLVQIGAAQLLKNTRRKRRAD